MNYLSLGNLDLYYQDVGSGYPLVLVHGLGSDHTVWDGLVPLLKEQYRVLAVDLRGHGSSSKSTGPYSMKLFSEDIVRFLECLNVSQAHFIGHSMGGAVLQELALNKPNLISSLTFISSFAYIDSHLKEVLMDLLLIVRNQGFKPFFDACLELANTPEFIEANKVDFIRIRDEMTQTSSIASIKETIKACLKINYLNSLEEIKKPTMIIAGKQDIFTPPYHSIKIKNMISSSKMEIMAKGSHNMLVEKPFDTYFFIKNFLTHL